MRIDDVPRRLAILGGGYIAAEFAHVFAAFGAEVTVIARIAARCCGTSTPRSPSCSPTEVKERFDVRLDAQVSSIERDGDGVRLDLADGSVVSAADLLLVATGRIPNSDKLDLAARRRATCIRTGGWSSTRTSAPAPTTSGLSATSAPSTSSSTSPTTRRGW